MADAFHPENILPGGPGSLNQAEVQAEIVSDQCAVIFSAGALAVGASAGVFGLAPEFLSAITESRVGDFVENGIALAIVSIICTLSVQNIKAYRKRLKQARYDQRLIAIAEANGIDPTEY